MDESPESSIRTSPPAQSCAHNRGDADGTNCPTTSSPAPVTNLPSRPVVVHPTPKETAINRFHTALRPLSSSVRAEVLSQDAIGASNFTRVLGTPPDNEDLGNRSFTPGPAALFVETTTVSLSANAPGNKRARRHRAVATAAGNDGDS